jgi:hypothetical protein
MATTQQILPPESKKYMNREPATLDRLMMRAEGHGWIYLATDISVQI